MTFAGKDLEIRCRTKIRTEHLPNTRSVRRSCVRTVGNCKETNYYKFLSTDKIPIDAACYQKHVTVKDEIFEQSAFVGFKKSRDPLMNLEQCSGSIQTWFHVV
jgi:hypothetical protein